MKSPTDPVRSRIMRCVRSENTRPELIIRSLLHRLGYRFRLHRKDLPGKPDIVFPGRRKAIFIHGCFWHGHDCARGCRLPKANREYWMQKIARNKRRDIQTLATLDAQDWQTLVIWECEIAKSEDMTSKLIKFLDQPAAYAQGY